MDNITQKRFEGIAKSIQPGRIEKRIKTLATMVEADQSPYTRRAFSKAHAKGRQWLAAEFADAHLHVFTDAGGNLIGEHKSAQNQRSVPIVSGSHSDTVPGGGRYDGIAGILCGIEAALALYENGVQLAVPLWIMDFLAEEPGEFGVSCIGSRAIAGSLGSHMLENKNPQGETLAEAIDRVGGDSSRVRKGPIHGVHPFKACLELHIEQGPVLEQGQHAIGVVSGVVGIYRFMVHLNGQADHAGTTPMHLRKDALAGASHVMVALHQQARALYDAQKIVATVGQLQVEPGGANVVPSAVHFSLDVRAPTLEAAFGFWEGIRKKTQAQLEAWGTTLEFEEISHERHALFSSSVQMAVRDAATTLGLAHHTMPSGAGHDAVQISTLCPTGMVFIPCLAGRSHAAEEYASPEAMANGARVLLGSWLQMANQTEL